MTDVAYLELLDLTKRIHAREISAVEATTMELARIAELDQQLCSYLTVTADTALADAREADAAIRRGEIRGVLHGAPVAVKDLCWTTNAPTSAGMAVYRDFQAPEDATVVRRLREAGAIILGKLAMTEGAYTDHHPEFPMPRNPWGREIWAGSSSSGPGIATSAGLCYGSIASDTGGSIRFPSAANGVTGIKGTWGRVSRHGIFDLAPTLDHIGPIARSAADAAAILSVIAGPDSFDPTSMDVPVPNYLSEMGLGIEGLRIGVDPSWMAGDIDNETSRVIEGALEVLLSLGATAVDVRMPETTQIVKDWFPLCGAEVAVAHQDQYPSRKAEYGISLAGLIDMGRALSAMDYQRIVLRRIEFSGRIRRLFGHVDLLIAPVQGIAAPSLETMGVFGEDEHLLLKMLKFTCPFDMSGSPSITMPGGYTREGLPIGFQLIAGHFNESALIRAGVAFQEATAWHRRHPTV